VYDCILWNIFYGCDGYIFWNNNSGCAWLYIVKCLLWVCMTIFWKTYCGIVWLYVWNIKYRCVWLYFEIFSMVVYDFFGEIYFVFLYACKLWNICCGCVWITIVKYLLCWCMNLYCETYTVVLYDYVLKNVLLFFMTVHSKIIKCFVWSSRPSLHPHAPTWELVNDIKKNEPPGTPAPSGAAVGIGI